MKVAFIIAILIHAIILAVLLLRINLDKPSRPNLGKGDIMHATFVPPAKGKETGKASAKKSAPEPTVVIEDPKVKEEALKREQQAKELKQRMEQKKLEEQKKQADLALKKKKIEEEKKKLEEQKKKEEELKKKLEEEKKQKAEEEKKKKLEEQKKLEEKKKLEDQKKLEEQKKKAEAEKKKLEEKKKQEELAKKKAEAAAKAKAQAEAKAKAQADSLEDDILGTADGDEKNGQGLGSGGSGGEAGYGDKVRGLIEQNWRIDPSMNGKRVVVTIKIDNNGMVTSQNCQGDEKVCASALESIVNVGMFPKPPSSCPECSNIKISMTPKL